MNTTPKQTLRQQMKARRNAEKNRERSSEIIIKRVVARPEFASANNVCCYISFRSEVQTRHLVNDLIESDKTLIVPWCDGPILQLTEIRALDELTPRTQGILEPRDDVRKSTSRNRHVDDCDVVIVPGLAFTTAGDRLGYGAGYYDRLLQKCSAPKIGIAFACQIVPTLPTEPTDIKMDFIVTETETFCC